MEYHLSSYRTNRAPNIIWLVTYCTSIRYVTLFVFMLCDPYNRVALVISYKQPAAYFTKALLKRASHPVRWLVLPGPAADLDRWAHIVSHVKPPWLNIASYASVLNNDAVCWHTRQHPFHFIALKWWHTEMSNEVLVTGLRIKFLYSELRVSLSHFEGRCLYM